MLTWFTFLAYAASGSLMAANAFYHGSLASGFWAGLLFASQSLILDAWVASLAWLLARSVKNRSAVDDAAVERVVPRARRPLHLHAGVQHGRGAAPCPTRAATRCERDEPTSGRKRSLAARRGSEGVAGHASRLPQSEAAPDHANAAPHATRPRRRATPALTPFCKRAC